MLDHDALRSGLSYWRAAGPPPISCPELDGDVECEVAVVGGGITGALVGYLLVQAGVNVVLVDRERPGLGSTAASTGLLQYAVDTPLVELIQRIGERPAVHAYHRGLRAIEELAVLSSELCQPCGFARRSSLYLASTSDDARHLASEHECRQHFGFDVNLLSASEVRGRFGFSAPAALYSCGDGEIDPYALTQTLLRAALDLGARAFQNAAVIKTEEGPDSVTLTTPVGKVKARLAVFATGYAAHEFFARGPGKLHTTYAAASEPLADAPAWQERCLIWETARPYFYARQTPDGRAIIGGEDTDSPGDHESAALIEHKTRALVKRFGRLFPALRFEPQYSWAGVFAETKDGLPYIGPPPGHARTMFALGYGGNGITFGMIAARLLSDWFLGKPNEDAAVFSFGR